MKAKTDSDFPDEWRWLFEEGRKNGIASCADQIEKITADRDEWKQLAMSIPTKNAELKDATEALKHLAECYPELTDVDAPTFDELCDALRALVELKDIKVRIEAGTAPESAVNYYLKNKEHCWTMAREILKKAHRYE